MAAKTKIRIPKGKPENVLPEGFKPVTGSRIDGWFLVKTGNSIQGTLLDSFKVTGQFGEKKVYKIEVTAGSTEATSQEEGEFTAEKGDVIGLDEKGWLKGLGLIKPGTEIYVLCTGQEATAKKGQQPAWTFQIGVNENIPF